MSFASRLAITLTGALAFAAVATAQAPPPSAPSNAIAFERRLEQTQYQAQPQAPSYRRSIVHHNPYPYPNFYQSDETAGFRNPGGTGRYREYFPPGNQFQLNQERDPVQVAKFSQGGGAPDRAEQLQAEQVGISKYNSIQQHIDNYARPAFGYGFGVGGFGGFY
jgi:hypothetical protein